MNFDELRSKWNNDKNDDVQIPTSIKKLQSVHHPVEKIRQNMKVEFYMQVVAIIVLGFLPVIYPLPANLYVMCYITYAMMVVISFYYLYGFYTFYKKILPYNNATRESLLELYFELRLNQERYRSFGFLLLPFGIIWLGLYAYRGILRKGISLDDLSTNYVLAIVGGIIVFTAILMLAIHSWVDSFYGKYTKQIKRILDELKEEL